MMGAGLCCAADGIPAGGVGLVGLQCRTEALLPVCDVMCVIKPMLSADEVRWGDYGRGCVQVCKL